MGCKGPWASPVPRRACPAPLAGGRRMGAGRRPRLDAVIASAMLEKMQGHRVLSLENMYRLYMYRRTLLWRICIGAVGLRASSMPALEKGPACRHLYRRRQHDSPCPGGEVGVPPSRRHGPERRWRGPCSKPLPRRGALLIVFFQAPAPCPAHGDTRRLLLVSSLVVGGDTRRLPWAGPGRRAVQLCEARAALGRGLAGAGKRCRGRGTETRAAARSTPRAGGRNTPARGHRRGLCKTRAAQDGGTGGDKRGDRLG